jgi:hypothetical protein
MTRQPQKAQELGDEEYVKALYFGNPKQGKTSAMARAAHLGLTIAVDTESGQGWLKKPLRDLGIPVENIKKFKATSMDDMEQVYWEIQAMFADGVDIKAVCVDHMTDLEARLLTHARDERIMRETKSLRIKAESGNELAAKELAEVNWYKNDRDDYGVWTNQGRKLMRLYRDLPCHVAFAAHFRTEGGMKVPSLTEKFRVELMGSVPIVLACYKMSAGGQDAYVAQTSEGNGWYAGDRTNSLRPIIVNPGFDRVIKAATEGIDWTKDPEQVAFKQALTQ